MQLCGLQPEDVDDESEEGSLVFFFFLRLWLGLSVWSTLGTVISASAMLYCAR